MNNVTNITSKQRIEAYHIGESMLSIYEGVFSSDMRPRFALPGALDHANGVIDDHQLADYRRLAQASIDDAAMCATHADSQAAWTMHPAIMAAYAVALCLDPVVDLEAVQRKAIEALHYAPAYSAEVN